NVGKHADDLCVLNGMTTDSPAHAQATFAMHTGSVNFVRPSVGAWVVYGLGTENQDLPGYITINPSTIGGSQHYGSVFLPADNPVTRDFGTQCAPARRLAEAAVRFIEVCHGTWDHHGQIKTRIQQAAREVDQPVGALLADLKERGLLEDTLVLWGGEFGRTAT